MAAQKFKMAAAELKIGQNSPMHTLKLKFEAVVLADCMFWHMMRKEVFKFEILIPDEPIKIQDGRQKKNSKWLPKGSNIAIFFTKSTLKFKFKVVIFTGCFICTCL